MSPTRRIVSADPGLMSAEELLSSHKGGRRRSLERMIALNKQAYSAESRAQMMARVKEKVRWFLEHARVQISVSWCSFWVDCHVILLLHHIVRNLSSHYTYAPIHHPNMHILAPISTTTL